MSELERCECGDDECPAHFGFRCGNVAEVAMYQESSGDRMRVCTECSAFMVEDGNYGLEFDAWMKEATE